MIIYGIKYQNKIIYVGQTIRSLKRRMSSYKHSIKNDKIKTYIVNHLRFYGLENHEFSIIEQNINHKEKLNEREIFYIKFYNTFYPNGMNLTEGGDSPIFSNETKNKMSNSRKGKIPWNKGTIGLMGAHWTTGIKLPSHSEKWNRKIAKFGEDNHFFGKKHSKESLEKMSQSLRGRKTWNKIESRIIKADKDNNVIEIYPNKEAVLKDGFEIRSLNRAISKKITYKGFYFRMEQ